MHKIIYLVNNPDFFLSHRLEIALNAKKEGYDVLVATPIGDSVVQIEQFGFKHRIVPISRSGSNPLREVLTMVRIIQLFLAEKPDIVHLVTIKPVLYGALAARFARIKGVVAAVSGLGSAFISGTVFSNIRLLFIKNLYRLAFKHKNLSVIFQNLDDKKILVEICKIPDSSTTLIQGSGVSLCDYPVVSESAGKVVVVMASRLLVDKGVCEYIDASRLLTKRGVNADFRLIGSIDEGNNTSISKNQIDKWKNEGVVQILGFRKDIASQYSEAHIVCLPSYREGLPKSLIEAAACGRPVVTTDVPGCRDAIVPGKTGLLAISRCANSLADTLEVLINDSKLRKRLGKNGRKMAEEIFDVNTVVEKHMQIYKSLIAKLDKL